MMLNLFTSIRKNWAETIKDWPNSRTKDITKDYGMDEICYNERIYGRNGKDWP